MRVIAIGIGASTAFGNGGGCRSLLFDGVNEDLLVTPASNFSFQWTNTWSIEAWIFPQSTTAGIKGGISKWDGSAPRGWFFTFLGYNPPNPLSGALRFQLRQAAAGYLDAYSNSTVNFDQWNHVAVTYDGSGTNAGVTFYINSTASSKPNAIPNPAGSGPITSGTIINSEPVTIHSLPDNGNYGSDYLHSMRVWNVELTAAEVLTSFSRSSIPQQGSLLLDINATNSTFNGTEFNIVDSTGLNTVVSRNMEIGDLTTNCP